MVAKTAKRALLLGIPILGLGAVSAAILLQRIDGIFAPPELSAPIGPLLSFTAANETGRSKLLLTIHAPTTQQTSQELLQFFPKFYICSEHPDLTETTDGVVYTITLANVSADPGATPLSGKIFKCECDFILRQ